MPSEIFKILAVDDNSDNLITLKALLADTFPKARVFTAQNGSMAVELASREDPDVILFTISMPGMDGYEICRRLKNDERTHPIPVVFLTSSTTDQQARVQALEAGGEAFLSRPIEPEELSAQIRSMVKIKTIHLLQRQEKERLEVLVTKRTSELEQELCERRKIETDLRQEHERSIHNQTAMLNLLEDLKEENEAREKSEAALRESEQRNRTLFETMTTGVIYQDRTGKILSANPAALHVLGVTWDEVHEKGMPDSFYQMIGEDGLVIPPDKQPGYTAIITGKPVQDVLMGVFNQIEQRVHWLLTTAIPQFQDGENSPFQVYVTFSDITELRQAEENLRQTHQQLNAVIQASPLGISALDREGHLTLWSPATERLFGWSEAEVLGKELPIIPEQNREEVLHQIQEEIEGKVRTGLENVRLRKDGVLLDISISTAPVRDSQGKIAGSMTIYENITERKRAEAQLHLLSTALEAAANAIVITDRSGSIQWINPAYTRLTGYGIEEAFGKNPRILKSGLQDQNYYQDLWKTILAGQVWHNELVNRRKDGSLYTEEEIITPLMDQNATITHFIGIKQDITERKQHERELETVSTVSAALRSASSQVEMLPVILDQLLLLLNVEGATIELLDPESGDLVIELGRGVWEFATDERIPHGEGLSAQVIATRLPYLNNNVKSDPKLFRPDLSSEIIAAAGTLLMAQNQIIGLLWIGSQRALTSQDLRQLTAIADMAANAIHRAMLHEQTENRLRQLAALRKIDQAITSSFDIDIVLKTFVEQVLAQLQVDAVAVLLYDPLTFTLEFGSGSGFQYDEIEKTSILLGEGLAGRAAMEKHTLGSPYLVTENYGVSRAGMLQKEGFVSHHVTPVIVKQQLKGVLEVFHRARLHPDPEWLGFFEAFANQAAIAIDNAQLFEGLQRSNLDLTLAYDATIEGWSRAMDLRDKDTENHTRRVTELTIQMADLMGVSQNEIVHIRRGALLHDIGKLGVPDTILLKTEKLSTEEWLIMRQHPTLAYDMLFSVEYLRPALDIPYCHHEKWDGSGYPRGLKGEQIPFSARLFAVVDVYDALTSDRPYRKAWTHQTAMNYIREETGRHFDPSVVEVFLRSNDFG